MSPYSHPPATIAAAPCEDGGTPAGRDVGETNGGKRTVYIVEELLAAGIEQETACAVVDGDLGGATSLELQDRLRRGGLPCR